MSNPNSYSVPSLSLSSSRSRKNIPTRDLTQEQSRISELQSSVYKSNYQYESYQKNSNVLNYAQDRETYKPFVPKPPKQFQTKNSNFTKNQPKQISRNVYLNQQDQQKHQTNERQSTGLLKAQSYLTSDVYQTSTNQAIERARQVLGRSSSRGSLLRNPQSRVQIENQVKQASKNVQFKKIDINKALFERKIAKMMQQLSIYDNQFDTFYQDSTTQQIQELESIKQNNKEAHESIIRDLTALIS